MKIIEELKKMKFAPGVRNPLDDPSLLGEEFAKRFYENESEEGDDDDDTYEDKDDEDDPSGQDEKVRYESASSEQEMKSNKD